MDRDQVASVLSEIGTLLELQGESPFRVNAYHNGARAIQQMEEDLATVVREGRLTSMPGIGDTLGAYNHADVAASIIKPFVSEDLHWMVEHHAEFQGYYFFHYIGLDRNVRDKYAGHPQYDGTADGPAGPPADAPADDIAQTRPDVGPSSTNYGERP